jgi:hypothetical protein
VTIANANSGAPPDPVLIDRRSSRPLSPKFDLVSGPVANEATWRRRAARLAQRRGLNRFAAEGSPMNASVVNVAPLMTKAPRPRR